MTKGPLPGARFDPRRDELLRKELTDDFPAEQMRIVGFLRTLYPRVLVSLHAEALHNTNS